MIPKTLEKMAILPTHQRFQPVRSGLRLREKYVLMIIFVAFIMLCFGAFFFVPDLRDKNYLENAYRRFVGVNGDVVPLKPPKNPRVHVNLRPDGKSCHVRRVFLLCYFFAFSC